MRRLAPLASCVFLFATAPASPASADPAVTLAGSKASMERQNRIARQHSYAFLRTSAQVLAAVARGELSVLEGNRDYAIADASFPFARSEVRTFIERLGAQHRAACGERLVVTSLTRPLAEQPRNASPLSVHPAGMAVDLRVSQRASCRRWLETTLLALERRGVLDATREHFPPHYHVALFPTPYARYLTRMREAEAARLAAEKAERETAAMLLRMRATVEAGHALLEALEGEPTVVAAASLSGFRPLGGWLGLFAVLPAALIAILRRRMALAVVRTTATEQR